MPEDGATGDWAAVDAAFDRALDLKGEARRSYLDSLPARLRQEVEGLLEATGAEGPLSRDVNEVAGHLLLAADRSLDPQLEGRRVGSWRLLERLGAGGMGVVHRAERADGAFEQTAALKIIRWELADSVLVQRFLAERQILAQLSHPHIASLYDGGMTESGLPYLVLEYIDGRPLDAYCQEETLDQEQRIRLLIQVARAVDFAHRRLVVHRDLKPTNILVDADGSPKLLDFGVAKLLDDAAPHTTLLAPMTPRYAAPEQRQGEAVSVATDVWALGKMLQELLEDPADRDLRHILQQALREEPDRRYRTAGDLADDLERYLQGLPVRATSPTFGYRLGKWAQRRQALTAALAATFLVALLGVVGVVWQAQEARLERDQARREAQRAEQVTEFLKNLFQGSTPRLGAPPSVHDLLDEGAQRIRDEMADAPLVRAELLVTLGQSYKWLGDFSQAESLMKEALRLVEAEAPGSVDHAMALTGLGGVVLLRDRAGDPQTAEALFLQALALLEDEGLGAEEPSPGGLQEQTAKAGLANSLGMAYLAQADAASALPWLRRSVESFKALEDDHSLAMARANLATALDGLNIYAEAEAEHRAAASLYQRAAPDNTSRAQILDNLALNLLVQGRMAEAEAAAEEALELVRTSPGSSTLLASTEANAAYILLVGGRAREAAELAGRARRVLDRELPGSDSALGTRFNLGRALAMTGDLEAALPLLEASVQELIERFGPDHGKTARGRVLYGAALLRAGRAQEARRELEAAEQVALQSPPSSIGTADLAVALAALRCDTGLAAAGLADAAKAQGLYREVFGADAWLTARANVEQARCLDALGRTWDRDLVAESRRRLEKIRGQEAWETRRAELLLR